MEYRLVTKNYNNLYTIHLTKFCKVLVRVISGVIIIFNFYIYKKLFSLISLIFKIFLPLYIKLGSFKNRL